MIKTIVFDLDGTLVDTIGGITWACNQVLQSYGYPVHSTEAYMSYVGSGLTNTILSALPSEIEANRETPLIKEMIKQFLKVYNDNPVKDTHLYTGVLDLLESLKKKGITWGIHTNKHQYIAEKVAGKFFDPKDYIALVGTSDNTPKKPDPRGTYQLLGDSFNIEEVVFVGDTEVDIATAKKLGVTAIAVGWGFRSKEELLLAKPDVILEHPQDLLNYLDQIE